MFLYFFAFFILWFLMAPYITPKPFQFFNFLYFYCVFSCFSIEYLLSSWNIFCVYRILFVFHIIEYAGFIVGCFSFIIRILSISVFSCFLFIFPEFLVLPFIPLLITSSVDISPLFSYISFGIPNFHLACQKLFYYALWWKGLLLLHWRILFHLKVSGFF